MKLSQVKSSGTKCPSGCQRKKLHNMERDFQSWSNKTFCSKINLMVLISNLIQFPNWNNIKRIFQLTGFDFSFLTFFQNFSFILTVCMYFLTKMEKHHFFISLKHMTTLREQTLKGKHYIEVVFKTVKIIALASILFHSLPVVLVHDTGYNDSRSKDAQFMHKLCKHAFLYRDKSWYQRIKKITVISFKTAIFSFKIFWLK